MKITFKVIVIVLAILYVLYLIVITIINGINSMLDSIDESIKTRNEQVESYTPPSSPSVSRAIQAVLDEGYTDPKSIGAPMFSCSKEDSILTSATILAKNSNGKEVELKVCCGLMLRGCTVRH